MNRLKAIHLFGKLLLSGIKSNRIFDKAASLSYFSLIAFIPLVAAFVSVYDIFFPNYQEQLSLMFNEFLPYEDTTWLAYIEQFLDQAQKLGGIALIIFFIIALRVLMIIEGNINQIWGVDRSRNLGSRLSSFTLLLFWGPILMGLMGSLFFLLEKQQGLPEFLLCLGPKVITLFTFTMLFWTVPYTKVRLDSALWGALSVAVLLMAGKWGFLAYLRGMKVFSGILGSLGLILLFFITVNLMWFFVLLGTLVAYTHQNFSALKKEREEEVIPEDRYQVFWALSVLAFVARRFLGQEEPLTVTGLAESLSVPLSRLESVVRALSKAGLIVEAGKEGQLLLTRSPATVTVGEVLMKLHSESLEVPATGNQYLQEHIGKFSELFRQTMDQDPWRTPVESLAEKIGEEKGASD